MLIYKYLHKIFHHYDRINIISLKHLMALAYICILLILQKIFSLQGLLEKQKSIQNLIAMKEI